MARRRRPPTAAPTECEWPRCAQELYAARSRLLLQDGIIDEQKQWATEQVALHRSSFDKALASFVEQATDLSDKDCLCGA